MNAPLAKTNSRNSVSSVRRPLPRRSSLVCAECETLVQAPVASHIIDKGIPTTGLLAQVLVAEATKYLLAVGPVAAEPSAPAAKAVTATSAQWLVGVVEANIVGAKGNARYRFQCTSASEPCTLSIQDDRFPVNSQRPEPLDLAVPLDSGPANAALAHTREIARGDPSLFNEQSADGDSLRRRRQPALVAPPAHEQGHAGGLRRSRHTEGRPSLHFRLHAQFGPSREGLARSHDRDDGRRALRARQTSLPISLVHRAQAHKSLVSTCGMLLIGHERPVAKSRFAACALHSSHYAACTRS